MLVIIISKIGINEKDEVQCPDVLKEQENAGSN
jgi:hypothetical protein